MHRRMGIRAGVFVKVKSNRPLQADTLTQLMVVKQCQRLLNGHARRVGLREPNGAWKIAEPVLNEAVPSKRIAALEKCAVPKCDRKPASSDSLNVFIPRRVPIEQF